MSFIKGSGFVHDAGGGTPTAASIAAAIDSGSNSEKAAIRTALQSQYLFYEHEFQPSELTSVGGDVIIELGRFTLPAEFANLTSRIRVHGTITAIWDNPTGGVYSGELYLCFVPAESVSSDPASNGVFYAIGNHRIATYNSAIALDMSSGDTGKFVLDAAPTPEGTKSYSDGELLARTHGFDGCWDGEYYGDRFSTDGIGTLNQDQEIVLQIHSLVTTDLPVLILSIRLEIGFHTV